VTVRGQEARQQWAYNPLLLALIQLHGSLVVENSLIMITIRGIREDHTTSVWCPSRYLSASRLAIYKTLDQSEVVFSREANSDLGHVIRACHLLCISCMKINAKQSVRRSRDLIDHQRSLQKTEMS